MNYEDKYVASYTTRGVITLDSTKNVQDAAKVMSELNIGCIIISEDGVPAGIITDKDLVSKVVARDKKPSQTSVVEIMSSPIVTIPSSATIQEALAIMIKKGINHLIVTEKGSIIGVFSYRNLISTEKAVL